MKSVAKLHVWWPSTDYDTHKHNFRILGRFGHNVSNTVQLAIDSNDLVHPSVSFG